MPLQPKTERLVTADQIIPIRREGQSLEVWVATLPLLFLSNRAFTRDVSTATRKGLLRSLGKRMYTTDLDTPVEALTRANALAIAALRMPDCVISHRSALEMRHAGGYLFLTGPKSTTEHLPGLVLKILAGPGRIEGDGDLLGIGVSSQARAYLENLAYTRGSKDMPRSLSRAAIEARLEQLLRAEGEPGLNRLRDQAKTIAAQLDAAEALATLDALIGALLNTREDVALEAPVAIARRAGLPYDEQRTTLFRALVDELRANWSGTSRPCPALLSHERQQLAFIDAYFSNCIEDTKFELDEARAIVYDDAIPQARPKDAHDILGTYRVLMDRRQMRSASEASSLTDFEHLLQDRHAQILAARPETRPGEYKRVANRAGSTRFVVPELVRGTLAIGLEHFAELDTPFCRAVFMMFLVTEVHPFDDGNGRLARIMMNAELVAADEHRIVIPTVYRPDYLGALRRLSRAGDAHVFARMLDRAHEYSSRLPYGSLAELVAVLEQTHAFDDEEGRVLRMPPHPDQ